MYFNSDVSDRDYILVYLCEAGGQLPSSPWSLEIAEVGYSALEDLAEGTDRGTVERMQEYLGARERSATW